MREDLRYLESLIEEKSHSSHPSDDELANFIDNKLDKETKEKIINHLVYCNNCSDVVNEVIAYKKNPKFINNLIIATPLIALVASLIIFVYMPSSIIGMVDLSISSTEFRDVNNKKENMMIDGDKFLKEITQSTDVTYLEKFNQAEQEKSLHEAIGLYQEAINTIPKNSNKKERLKEKIIIRSRILQRASEENNKRTTNNYKTMIIDNIRTYHLQYQKKDKK